MSDSHQWTYRLRGRGGVVFFDGRGYVVRVSDSVHG
jgi:hypothetical protein